MNKFLLLLLCLLCINSYSQKAILKGTIIDKRTNESIIGVNVIVSKDIGVITDIKGEYSIELDAGVYNVKYRFIGYEEESRFIELSPGEIKTVNLFLTQEYLMLDAIVVTAGRHEQKLSDVTVSMEIIKPSLIESNNITSMEYAVQKVPGVYIMDNQASIRGGSGYTYGSGSRTMLLVDDLPLLTGASGEIRWDFIPLENMEQVEIIKGASSALYGSSALNGVINFRTRFPRAEPESSITMFSGIYGNPKRKEIKWWDTHSPFFTGARFGHSQRFGNLDVVLGGNVQSEKGYQENHLEQRIRFNTNLRYRFKKIEGLSVGVSSNYMNRTGNIFLLWLDGGTGVWMANPTYQQIFYNTSFNIYPYLVYFPNQNTKHSIKTRVYSIRNRNDTEQENFDDTYYVEYQFFKILKNKLAFTTGSNFLYNESVSEIYSAEKHFGSSLALYFQADHKLFSRLNLSLGGRLEGYRIDDEELRFKPVFRTGLSYSVNEKTYLRSSFGMGYRYPTIAEKYTATSAGSIRIFPNPELKDETGWSSEAAIKRGFKINKWNGYADLALFWTEYNNMIEFMFDYHNPDTMTLIAFPDTAYNYFLNWIGFRAENVCKARIYGIDFTVTGEGKFFGLPATLLAGYTYTNPIDISNNERQNKNLKTTSKDILKYRFYHNVKFDFELTYKKITFGMNSEYASNIVNIDKAFEDSLRYPNGTPILQYGKPFFLLPGLKEYREKNNKGYMVFDLRLGWNVSNKVRFTATVKNILNNEYMIRPGDVRPPRTYVVQLTVRI